MTTDWENMMIQLAQVQADIRQLQKEMDIMPRTLEQRAADWERKQAEIARAQIATAPRIRFPKI
jgi:Tfp pilus assembly protein FimV